MSHYEGLLNDCPNEPHKVTWEKEIQKRKERIRLFKERKESRLREEAKERVDLEAAELESRIDRFSDFLILNGKILSTRVENAIRRGTFKLSKYDDINACVRSHGLAALNTLEGYG